MDSLKCQTVTATPAEPGDLPCWFSKLHRRLGATIIYVTHDQVKAMTMADRIFIMQDGTLQQTGRPLEVYGQPANRFVAGFEMDLRMSRTHIFDKETSRSIV